MIKCNMKCIYSNGKECELHPDKIELREVAVKDFTGKYVDAVKCNMYIYKDEDIGLR